MYILSLENVNSPCPSTMAMHNFGMIQFYAWDGIFTILANAKLNEYSISERNKRGSL